jgi:hypothetical protein
VFSSTRSRSLPDELLGTPRSNINGPSRNRVGNDRGRLEQQIDDLLPTPLTTDNRSGSEADDRRDSTQLRRVAELLLPTPTGRDSEGSGGSGPEHVTLTDAVVRTELGTRDNPRHTDLLPTPRASDGPKGAASAHARSEERLAEGKATLPEAIALLPTPIAHDARGGKSAEQVAAMRERSNAGVSNLNEVVVNELFPTPVADPDSGNGHARDLRSEALDLLPTPNGSLKGYEADPDAFEERRQAAAERHGNNGLGIPLGVAVRMLPTPTTTRGNGARGQDRSDELLLPGIAVNPIEWGKYAAAVERAEAVTGTAAPVPAIPDGKEGKHRLHDRFVEWMMMLWEGWVTGHGLTRQKALERLGNGVVPLQAAAATAMNLRRLAEIKRALS